MPINQPPISDDPVKASWDFETTNMVNLLEEKIKILLQEIKNSEDLDDLKSRIKEL